MNAGESTPDIVFENHGTIFLARPLTLEGHEYIEEHAPEHAQYFGYALVIEHRYASDWYQLATNDGLLCQEAA